MVALMLGESYAVLPINSALSKGIGVTYDVVDGDLLSLVTSSNSVDRKFQNRDDDSEKNSLSWSRGRLFLKVDVVLFIDDSKVVYSRQ